MDVYRWGQLGVSLFLGAGAYHVLGDRTFSFSTSQEFDDQIGNDIATASWEVEVKPWITERTSGSDSSGWEARTRRSQSGNGKIDLRASLLHRSARPRVPARLRERAPQRSAPVLLGAENRSVPILPLNVAMAMPRAQFGSPILWAELERFLRARQAAQDGRTADRARSLGRSIQQARAGEKGPRAGYEDAARALALELRNHAAFYAMISPSLVVREAPIANRSARWDGVERELEFEADGLAALRLHLQPPAARPRQPPPCM
jgi:hypothetical protein